MSAKKELELLVSFIQVLEGISKELGEVKGQCQTLFNQTNKILINEADRDHPGLKELSDAHDLAVVMDANVIAGTVEIRTDKQVLTTILGDPKAFPPSTAEETPTSST